MDDVGYDGFEWDEAKSDKTFEERGIDFDFAARVFDGSYLEREDRRRNYGEQRFIVTGEVDGIIVSLAWTPRERNRRIITAWPASRQERRKYDEYRKKNERTNPCDEGPRQRG